MAAQRRSVRIDDGTWAELEGIARALNEGRDPALDPLRAEATPSMIIKIAITKYLKHRKKEQMTAVA